MKDPLEGYSPDLLKHLSPPELARLTALLKQHRRLWSPLPGPQTMACVSQADVVGFGGAAGGGKTDLGVGLATTEHRQIGICRRNGTEMMSIVNRIADLTGAREGYNGQDNVWRMQRPDGVDVQIEFMSFPNAGDVQKYRGRPHDLLVFDEAATMRLADVRFLMGWLRTTHPQQRCRVLMTFNPPDTVEGRWVLSYFAPWLDKKHPNPALPGELRWYAMLDGREVEVRDGHPFKHGDETIHPQSRTFVPSRITDNPFLLNTGYMAQLQALEEPMRSQLLYGDFNAGVKDPDDQVIPTAWIEAAMARWTLPNRLALMDSLGADVARGGGDRSVFFPRHGMWFNFPHIYPGSETPDGAVFAGRAVQHLRDGATIHIDIIGVGSSPYDQLRQIGAHVIGVNVSEKTARTDRSGRLRFKNVRSELYWRAREAFDPQNNTGIAIPPVPGLLAELTAFRFEHPNGIIQVSSTDEVKEVIGKSPDLASAFVLALMDTPPIRELRSIYNLDNDSTTFDYNPYGKD